MANKKRSTRSKTRAARSDPNANIRWIALAVLVLAGIAVVWAIASAQKPAASAGQSPKLVGTKQYASAPPMSIDKNKQYTATVKMANGGEFVIQLYPDKAPITVNSFVFLARQGYFDGVTFHRVLEDFMAQGGDPTGTGGGGPGYKFVNEDSDLTFDKPGVVAMANAGRDTNGSQFFITFGPVAAAERRLYHLRPGDQRDGRGQRDPPAQPGQEPGLPRRRDPVHHDRRAVARTRLPGWFYPARGQRYPWGISTSAPEKSSSASGSCPSVTGREGSYLTKSGGNQEVKWTSTVY